MKTELLHTRGGIITARTIGAADRIIKKLDDIKYYVSKVKIELEQTSGNISERERAAIKTNLDNYALDLLDVGAPFAELVDYFK